MKIWYVIISLCLIPAVQNAQGCDEECVRAKVKAEKSLEFPSYLSWKYCDTLKHDFMSSDIASLQTYSSKHFDTTFKGPIKNIVKLITQRHDWLSECDDYVRATRSERIFYDDKTTELIFGQLSSISKELNDVIGGARYSSVVGDETAAIVTGKFESLFTSVDDHKNLMHLKGKYVYY